MPPLLNELLPVLAALAGAVVGGVVAELRSLLQGSRERRRALRLLLFQLLDLRYSIHFVEPNRIFAALRRFAERQFGPDAAREVDTPEVQGLLKLVWQAAVDGAQPPRSAARYTEAVHTLAPYDPILAYYLSEQDQLARYDHEVRSYVDRVTKLPDVMSDPRSPNAIPVLEAAMLDMTRKNALETLRDRILLVARTISTYTWWRTRRIVRRQDQPPDEKVDRELHEMLSSVMSKLRAPGAA